MDTHPDDRPLFGISVTPYAEQHPGIVEQVLAAERGGLDLVGIQDHPYQRRFLDTFALIGDLMARTQRLRFFPDVASLPMRPPPMMESFVGGLLILPATAVVIAGFMKAADEAPEEMSTIANVMNCPPMPFLPEEIVGKLVVLALMGYCGEPESGDRAMRPRSPTASGGSWPWL